MKTRITYLQPPSSSFVSSQAHLTPHALHIDGLDAAKEERITVDVGEVSALVCTTLKQFHELHLRWATEERYEAVEPWGSRVSPGLHGGVRLVEVDEEVESHAVSPLCDILREAFDRGVYCEGILKSLTAPPTPLSESSASSPSSPSTTTHNYYAPLPTHHVVEFITQHICPLEVAGADCRRRAEAVQSADSIDIDYDAESQALVVSAYWGRSPTENGWTEEIAAPGGKHDRVEVGLLGTEKAVEAGEIKMGGLLGVVGVDGELKPTLFSFPSRHHVLDPQADFSVSFAPPTGMHPTMTISLSAAALETPPAPAYAECALHAYLSLPSYIFADKFQLMTADNLFLDSHHLSGLRAVSGATDLEAPDWVVSQWGSNWLLELATPEPTQFPEEWNVTIPLHLRYMRPSETGYRGVDVPWPVVFWACSADDPGVNPFDRTNLGWDAPFSPRTTFYQVNPSASGDRLVEGLDVPVLQLKERGLFGSKTVEWGTVMAISLGFLWVLWRLVAGAGTRRAEGEREKKAQ
ncbi:protein pbn1 [Aspergillus heteromorphus CBS 117.55]|uniref:Protein PBN1 n=1 Tax=Aspergillus heteromorphus CBS 117.55 TaxID=1448321 RepID=A0A317VAA0_9EURO|nr:protein pbn1 [Aspergillus heteromorphus CBS 117.55]PWY70279.1 protein pbn1 [Aspergillus heteromorphus CBS 117.55]